MKFFLVMLLVILLSYIGVSQDNKTTWKLDAQIQLRSEIDGRDFSNKTHPYLFASLRTRLGANANVSDKVLFYAQLQDSRIFGEEATTGTNTKNVDLHQGYVKLVEPLDLPLTFQAGRFEIAYGTERFLGSSQWSYISKSWDGFRMSYDKSFKLDIFTLTKNDSMPYVSSVTPATYTLPAKSIYSASVYGFWFVNQIDKSNRLDLFAYYDLVRNKNKAGDNDLAQTTVGLNHNGNYGDFSTLTEGAYQVGKKGSKDVSSFLVSFQGFLKIGAGKIGIGGDVVSGTDPIVTDKYNTFDASLGTAHKVYSYMDYFFESASASYSLGLNDLYLTSNFAIPGSDFSLAANLHTFSSNKDSYVYGRDLGRELDITLKYDVVKGTSLTWGGSVFLPGDLMNAYFNTTKGERNNTGFWSYVMITANF